VTRVLGSDYFGEWAKELRLAGNAGGHSVSIFATLVGLTALLGRR
jgi:hypothetical protein